MSSSTVSRREVLSRVGGGLGMLSLGSLLAGPAGAASKTPHFVAKAKRVIYLFMSGGPSQVDTFDPKPMLKKLEGQRPKEADIRTASPTAGLLASTVKFVPSGESGIPVSEHLEKLSAHVDEMAIVRSMHTDFPNHAPALCMMNLGVLTPTRPSLGAWTSYGLGSENENLPSYIALCPGKPVVGPKLWGAAFLPGRHQATHINHTDLNPEKMIPHLKNEILTRSDQRGQLDLIQQLNRAHQSERRGDDALETRIRSMELAFRMQAAALDVFDISKETKATQESYGSSRFSKACLLARRISERGVRFVQVFYGNRQPWDTHSKHNAGNERLCKDIDQPIAQLLSDLKQRGLLDETLVIWGGEFGRTPTSQNGDGRDHNPNGFSMWLAGGGIKGGTVHGETDQFGFTAVKNKVHVHDLHATVLHLLGLDHERLTYQYSGRDFRLTDIEGEVVQAIVA
ncbi:MAG: sulfatase [Planctomycetaceae bacterium]|nr:sulfatase [Planctomycetaceae bacterium]